MMRIRISADAVSDLNAGFWFYEAQQPGLGEYFAASLRADIEGLRLTGGVHRLVHRDFHRLLSRAFPYGIFYTRQNDEVVIWAVIDLRRDPAWVRERLR